MFAEGDRAIKYRNRGTRFGGEIQERDRRRRKSSRWIKRKGKVL
jgi:hypothetical protein